MEIFTEHAALVCAAGAAIVALQLLALRITVCEMIELLTRLFRDRDR